MLNLKALGFGWPDGPESAGIYSMPGRTLIMLDSEARWHYDKVRRQKPEALVLWRGIGTPPAKLDMDPSRYADTIVQHWHEQPHWGTEHFVGGNEFNLNYERGDNSDDWDRATMEAVYHTYGTVFLSKVRSRLRAQLPGITLHYPAWAPGHYMREYNGWISEAQQWDVIDIHAYGTPEEIKEELDWFAYTFPTKQKLLTEWNSGVAIPESQRVANERAVLIMLDRYMSTDWKLLGCCYFIWKWSQNPMWDIQGNSARLALFQGAGFEEERTPDPMPTTPTPLFDFVRGFKTKADELGRSVVGDPLENEHATDRAGHEIVHQLTTKGEFVWWAKSNLVHFTPGR